MKDNNSLAHSTWNCKYHIVFAPKYRRMEIYGKIRKDIGVIISRLWEQKEIEIIEAELCSDHSSLMIFDRYANLKYKYGNRHFWCQSYYVWIQ